MNWMGPDYSGLKKVQARVNEIEERLSVSQKAKPERKFVEVLTEKTAEAISDASNESIHELPAPHDSIVRKMDSSQLDSLIRKKSRQYGVDEDLVRAVIRMESGGKPRVVSKAGAVGLMQLMPSTAKMLGVENSFDPEQNVDGGVRYLKGLLERYHGDERFALAAYHSGPGRVDKYGGIPPFPIVTHYVETVTALTEKARRQ